MAVREIVNKTEGGSGKSKIKRVVVATVKPSELSLSIKPQVAREI